MANPIPAEDDIDYFMWPIFKEKHGEEEALKHYFPKTLAANHDLQLALFQIKSATALINQTMEYLNENDDT